MEQSAGSSPVTRFVRNKELPTPRLPALLLGVVVAAGLVAGSLTANAAAATSTNLFSLLRVGTASEVRPVLKRGVDLQARDAHGDTPLMSAALYAEPAVLEWLLEAGAEVNATNAAGATALMRAATMPDKAQLLVLAGADVNARSVLGNTALILAARKAGNHPTVRLLLDRGAAVNATNAFGATALMAAAAANDLATVRLLLDHGAAIDAAPLMSGDGFIWGGGRTALQWASFHGNEAIIRLLLNRGAKVDQFTLAGGALAQAAWGGRVGAAQLLLKAGAAVDQRDLVANYTPLHWAASSEHASPALVNVLLASGADARAEGGQPVDNFLGAIETPLSLARKRGETPIVRALMKAGAIDSAAAAPAPARRTATVAATSRQPGPADEAPVVQAIQRALTPLTATAENSALTFQRHASKQQCISCHQQQLPLAALSLAHARGFATDRAAVRHQLELMQSFMSSTPVTPADPRITALEMSLQATFHPEAAIFAGYASLPLQLEQMPASDATDATVHQLAAMQHADGHWSWNLPRPPIQASDIAATALAVHTIRHFGIPARRAELNTALQRAKTWLAKASAETGEEQAYQLLGLAWAGETSPSLARLAQGMIATQRADGGWGQLNGLESDAYATGQALYALMEGGHLSASHPVVRRGLAFLLGNQQTDGTWHVRRRAHPFQPPMDSGFAHGADGWISSAGSSWAVMALATSLSPGRGINRSEYAAVTSGHRTDRGASNPAAGADDSLGTLLPEMTPVDFARDIQPVLNRSCAGCHSGARPKGGYMVTDRAAVVRGGARGEPVVVPGRPEASLLLKVVQDRVDDLEMPPLGQRGKYPALSREEIQRLRAWIRQGSRGAAEAAQLDDPKSGLEQVVRQ